MRAIFLICISNRQLFGEDDDASDLDAAAASGENGKQLLRSLMSSLELVGPLATEIDNLRQEASAFKVVRASLLSLDPTDVASSTVFTKVCLQH
jgi:hypothetical protein